METITKSDAEIQRQVLRELEWDPRVDENEVGVQVVDGIVTLAGRIGSYAKKVAAVEAAHRVHGVLDVADDLYVEIPTPEKRSDADVAHTVRDALRWHAFVDESRIHTTVTDGWVTLEGEVDHWFQRDDAARAIDRLAGLRGVTNRIAVRPSRVETAEIRQAIEEALTRQASEEAERIVIRVEDGTVTLSGAVRSWSERKAAERAAGLAPGVTRVHDRLRVRSHS